jgi:glycerol kinase
VEQDPEAIYQNVIAAVQNCLADFSAKGFNPDHIAAIGISNQRKPLWSGIKRTTMHPAIVWQCKRSAVICAS